MSTTIKPWTDIPPAGQLLRPMEVAQRTGLSRSQIYALIAEGKFPPFIKLSIRASAMPAAWLDAFIVERATQAQCSAANVNEQPA